MKNPILILPLITLLAACGPTRPASTEIQRPNLEPASFQAVSGEAGIQDTALFLAGRPVEHGAGLSRMQRTAAYQNHWVYTADAWRIGRIRSNDMRKWSVTELEPLIGDGGTILYPFGGPDLLYVNAMFPEARTYLLMGLEPVGEVPALESLPADEVLSALPPFRKATSTQMDAGYFITEDMRADLNRSVLRGVTPILLSSVALTGGKVESAGGISVGGKPGVELRFRDAAGRRRRAMYLNCDLSNSGFDAATRQWLAGFPRAVSYFKASSYLPHDSRFSRSRDFFLSHSRAILQDDSGIPFRHFGDDWSLHFFGQYRKPIALFARHAQDDLRQAYATNPARPLRFGSGYHVNQWGGNLMLAVRR
jgi:hypothetical protein